MILVNLVCEQPIVSSRAMEDPLGLTRPTALRMLRRLEAVDFLAEIDHGPPWQWRYVARELVAAMTEESS
jgi:hypothetical protein